MKRDILDRLRCPVTSQPLDLTNAREADGEIESGELITPDGLRRYPISNFIPRFVPAENYAASFGIQWNIFRRTQLDSVSGLPISQDRFASFTGWSAESLAGKWVLDVGCGAGRFAEVALQAGARVVALDYSCAVDACRSNLAGHPRLDILQGDIFSLPLSPGQFDFVYCLGVLQHTPNVERAFHALPPMLKPRGRLAVDVYPWLLRNIAWSKYWLRPVTKRLPTEVLLRSIQTMAPAMLTASRLVRRIPLLGHYLRYAIPVVNYEGVYPLSESQLAEWAVLDTFDMLAPAHDHPQRAATLRRWLKDAGLTDRSVERLGFFVGRGTMPDNPVAARANGVARMSTVA